MYKNSSKVTTDLVQFFMNKSLKAIFEPLCLWMQWFWWESVRLVYTLMSKGLLAGKKVKPFNLLVLSQTLSTWQISFPTLLKANFETLWFRMQWFWWESVRLVTYVKRTFGWQKSKTFQLAGVCHTLSKWQIKISYTLAAIFEPLCLRMQ